MEERLMNDLKAKLEEVMNAENHAELVDGTIIIQDRTTPAHNNAVIEIATALKNYILEHNGTCKVFTENVALYANELCENDKEFYLPDVMVVCDEKGLKEDGVHAAPLFIAEITSDSTKANDYGHKKEIYRTIGVEEYWVVDIQRKIVMKHLASEEFVPEIYMYPESMKVSVYPDFVMDVTNFMKA